ncbi:YigZ family protein [Anaerofustis stercorihominis]|uniref:YigZ family protein n=2 Tax=Anaerofustis stercorihominis TaxID=214853 RepID=B1C6M5_9FIRM|nr:YigZ family protein [Anaerofustis stercorihominis]EDS72662.1 YigZ family protein [Anaerofustis stercorihominis DSM 17244]MCQ4794038.1 YigZ family protein [Anaerofustis stercorihominis]RGD74660.1 YigZ family protein [Anaerofustis stercorihominis]
MNYITINDNFENSIEIKKSNFITHLFSVTSVDEVNVYLEEIRKEHYKANHNCYAYIIGTNMEIKKSSDDGEPSMTAGRPILNAMEKNDLTNALIVVTRYFGGIKLGASGLIRAYSSSAGEVIKCAELVKKVYTTKIKISYDYSLHGKIETFLRSLGYKLDNAEFTDKVEYKVYVPIEDKEKFKEDLIALTNAKININEEDNIYIDEYLDK